MAAPMFTVNAHRYDPYRTFMFQVIIDGQPVAGLKKMSVLKKSTAVAALIREGKMQGLRNVMETDGGERRDWWITIAVAEVNWSGTRAIADSVIATTGQLIRIKRIQPSKYQRDHAGTKRPSGKKQKMARKPV